MEYWDRAFKEKTRRWLDSNAGRAQQTGWLQRQAALYAPAAGQLIQAGRQGGDSEREWVEPGTGRRAQRKRRQAEAAGRGATQQPPQKKSAPAQGEANEYRRGDGRYTHAKGREICYNWARYENGCAQECLARPPREHACEWCREPHKSIRCPTKPGWKPTDKGKGKAKRQ